ncbi:MAG: VanZ family protein [Deltaproteobacteria bacterium]|nr:VanZ family protein [Deltaproteobacteria bacterium]
MSRDPSSSRALPSLRHAAPWLGVVATLLGVLAMSARGYALSRWAQGHGLGWLVSWTIPAAMALVALRYGQIYEHLGVAAAVAKPWVVVGMVAEACVVLLGDSEIEHFHVLTFGLLGFALVWALVPRYGFRHGGALVLLVGTALGLADEMFQGFLPDRVYDGRDVTMNALAVAAALAFSCPFAPRLGRPPLTVPRGVWVASAVLASVVATSLALGARPHLGRKELIGSWQSPGECGALEVLTFRRDGRVLWQAGDGKASEGVWSLDANAFEAILSVDAKASRAGSPLASGACSFARAVPERGEIAVSSSSLALPRGGRAWTRHVEPPR